jgi:hypothetical protein
MLGRDAGKNRIIYIKALAAIRQLTSAASSSVVNLKFSKGDRLKEDE